MSKVRVAIVGVGNCALALLQGLTYYADAAEAAPGLVRPKIGPYGVGDIEVVAAFDVAASKVGLPLHTAAVAWPNKTYEFAKLPPSSITVQRGPTLDGLGRYLRDWVSESPQQAADVAQVLRESRAEVLVNYLPVGSQLATEYYATAALEAGCALVNCIPAFIASDAGWQKKFVAAGLPVVGDDIKSQVGATIVNRVLAQLFRDRGVKLKRVMQLNVGGNGDFLNMLERERLVSKKISKTEAVVSVSGVEFENGAVHVGPSDYVEWLGDRKWAYIRMEGVAFGGAPLSLECKLEVWDSPNSAGIVIDAVRCAKLAMDRGQIGAVVAPSVYFMKAPPQQMDDDEALRQLEHWIIG